MHEEEHCTSEENCASVLILPQIKFGFAKVKQESGVVFFPFAFFFYFKSHSTATKGYKNVLDGHQGKLNHLLIVLFFFHFQSAMDMVTCKRRYNRLANSSKNMAPECPDWNLNLPRLFFGQASVLMRRTGLWIATNKQKCPELAKTRLRQSSLSS